MAKKMSLGRGLEALIPTDLDASILGEDLHRIQKILITDIVPSTSQPRHQIGKSELAELATSIKSHGVLQPIIVVRQKNGKGYQIVAGERRWRGAGPTGASHTPPPFPSF